MSLAQAAQDFEPIDSGEHDVEHDQVEPGFARGAQSRFSVVDDDSIVAGTAQGARDMAREADFIFYDQYVHGLSDLCTARNGAKRYFASARNRGDSLKVTGLLLLIPCLSTGKPT